MTNSKIWLSSPHMGGNELNYVQEAFSSNWVAPLGPNVTGFEQDLENYVGNNSHIAALSSGTAALHLGLILLDVKAGDEVICQSFTFGNVQVPISFLNISLVQIVTLSFLTSKTSQSSFILTLVVLFDAIVHHFLTKSQTFTDIFNSSFT